MRGLALHSVLQPFRNNLSRQFWRKVGGLPVATQDSPGQVPCSGATGKVQEISTGLAKERVFNSSACVVIQHSNPRLPLYAWKAPCVIIETFLHPEINDGLIESLMRCETTARAGI